MNSLIEEFRISGRIRTSETYDATLRRFHEFRNGQDIMPSLFNETTAMAFENYLKDRHLTLNTISFYMRILRAAYNRAVAYGLTKQRSPFTKVYTGVAKTRKRSITLGSIRKIRDLDLSLKPAMDFARDMFMMSFYLRGMSFIDMAFLHKSDLKRGYLNYRRHKTGKSLKIKWHPEMQRIINKYAPGNGDYLLPILLDKGKGSRREYLKMGNKINRNLKNVASKAGISTPLTLYVARHSWATAALKKGVPLNVISAGMGHDSELTTRIYLASIETDAIDRANSLIIGALN